MEAWLDVDAGSEGEREGALVEVEAEAEAEFDIAAGIWEVYINDQASKEFKSWTCRTSCFGGNCKEVWVECWKSRG